MKLRNLAAILFAVLILLCNTAPTYAAEKWIPLGEFKITHYCSCKKCCGKWGNVTYTGTTPTRYRTISVDPNVIPLGSLVYIETYGYRIAEDTGSGVKKNHIDVYTTTHQHALELGVQHHKVWLVKSSE